MAVPHPADRDVAEDVNLAIPNDPEPRPILVSPWNHQPLHRRGVGSLRVDRHSENVLQGDPPVVEDDQLLSEPFVTVEIRFWLRFEQAGRPDFPRGILRRLREPIRHSEQWPLDGERELLRTDGNDMPNLRFPRLLIQLVNLEIPLRDSYRGKGKRSPVVWNFPNPVEARPHRLPRRVIKQAWAPLIA